MYPQLWSIKDSIDAFYQRISCPSSVLLPLWCVLTLLIWIRDLKSKDPQTCLFAYSLTYTRMLPILIFKETACTDYLEIQKGIWQQTKWARQHSHLLPKLLFLSSCKRCLLPSPVLSFLWFSPAQKYVKERASLHRHQQKEPRLSRRDKLHSTHQPPPCIHPEGSMSWTSVPPREQMGGEDGHWWSEIIPDTSSCLSLSQESDFRS